jgi:serine protease Do
MTIMKTMVQIIGCLVIVLLLSFQMMLSASSKGSSTLQKKNEIKNSGWIGIVIQDVSEKIAREEKLESEEGAYVKEVVKDSPADSAGIQEGDVIVEFHGKKLFDADELVKIVRRTTPGTKGDLLVIRDSQKMTPHITVGKNRMSRHPLFRGGPNMPDVQVFVGNHIIGLQLLTPNEQLGEYFDAPNNEGVLVEEVENKSTAEKAGFKAGDIIIRVGKRTVDAVEKIQKELRKHDEGDKIEFEIIRKGVKKTLTIEMEEGQSEPHNFFFRKPHMRMFRTDPFDDTEIQLDMDEFQSGIDRMQRELRKSIPGDGGIPHDISQPVERFVYPHLGSTQL